MAPLRDDAHLLEPVLSRAEREPDRVVAAYPTGDGLVDVTAREFRDRAWALAKGLMASGVVKGDRVGLMAHTRLEWMLVDYAVLMAGGITVPIYDTSSAEQVQWIVGNSGAVLLVVETPAMYELYEHGRELTPDCRELFVIEAGGLDELVDRGHVVEDSEVEARIAALRTSDVATIVYTSGTTGRPKGCVLTHGNLRANVFQNLHAVGSMLGDDETGFLFLPLAHSMTKIVALVGVEHGIRGAFATDMAHLVPELPVAQPTMVVAVPRVFEKVYNGARQKAEADGKGKIFDHAAEIAVRWSEQKSAGHVHPTVAVQHALFDRLVYAKIRAVFGGKLRYAISGGGPLGARLTHFFNGVGVRVLEGYGLTETSPTLTLNTESRWEPGSVGQPLDGTEIKIAPDGEILARGPQVFGGYWRNEMATAEVFDDDGWFRTGDIGVLDDAGYLKITGRKKELLVTAAGKNVAPAPLEDRIRAHPLVSQAVVVGDARPFIAALVTLDADALHEWAHAHGREGLTMADAAVDPEVRAAIQAAIDDANESVSRAESIREFAILPVDLSIEAGELTPTLKVRREVVQKGYEHVIDDLYRS